MSPFDVNRLRISFLHLVPALVCAQQTREFGAASFVAPAGWAAQSQPNMQQFMRVDGPHRCMLLVSAEEQAPPALDAAFTRVWTSAFNTGTYRRADRPDAVERTSPAGYRHMVGEGVLEDRGGNRFLARLHVFPVGQRIQSVVFVASSREALDGCRQDLDAFFASLRFPSVSAETRSAAGGRPNPSPVATPPAPPSSTAPVPAGPNERATGGPLQFDNITFVPPAGWTIQRSPGVVQLTPTDTKNMEALHVLVLAGKRSSAPLANEFDATWAEVRSMLGAQQMMTVNRVPYDLERPARTLRGTEYVRGNGGLRRGDGDFDVEVFAFRAGDRVERVAVVSRHFRENVTVTTTWNRPDYWDAISKLVFTMKFANQPERALAPAGLRPGGIVGVWAGLSMNMSEIKTNFAIFFDNGLVYFGPKFPARGLLDIDPVVHQTRYMRDWGTYTMNGDNGTITMPYGTVPIRRLGAALELTTTRTPHRFVRFAMPDGPLDGTWCLSGGACLRLTPDGRFQDNGATRVMEHSTYVYPSTPSGGQGRYTLRAYTLILNYDGGPEIRMGFAGLPPDRSAPSPKEIRLGFEADLLIRR